MLDVIFRRFIAVTDGLLRVTMRNQRLMRRVREILLGVVRRCTAMMHRRLLVMLGGGHVVLRARENSDHDGACGSAGRVLVGALLEGLSGLGDVLAGARHGVTGTQE